jgi:nucleotide-binding universal stress UspA family protein
MAAKSRAIRDEVVDLESRSAADEPAVTYRHVLVPLDGSALAARAVPTARALAQRFDAVVHSVSVAKNAADADRMRLDALDALGGSDTRDRVHVVVAAKAVDGIEHWSGELESTVLCMTTHGRGRAIGSVVGSTARSLLERSARPIVVVGPSAERPPVFVSRRSPAPLRLPLSVPHLVACVDGSRSSEAVLPIAAAWAEALEMSLTILTVADRSVPPLDDGETWRRRFGPDGDAERYVGDLVAQWSEGDGEVRGHVAFDPISPSSGLKAYLDRRPAGLLAVSTASRRGWRRLVFGAGAAGMVRVANVPTLVVPQVG